MRVRVSPGPQRFTTRTFGFLDTDHCFVSILLHVVLRAALMHELISLWQVDASILAVLPARLSGTELVHASTVVDKACEDLALANLPSALRSW